MTRLEKLQEERGCLKRKETHIKQNKQKSKQYSINHILVDKQKKTTMFMAQELGARRKKSEKRSNVGKKEYKTKLKWIKQQMGISTPP